MRGFLCQVAKKKIVEVVVQRCKNLRSEPPVISPKAKQFSNGWYWCFSTFPIRKDLGVSENRGVSPQIIHFNKIFHYFHHPFWGPLFLETPIWEPSSNYNWCPTVFLDVHQVPGGYLLCRHHGPFFPQLSRSCVTPFLTNSTEARFHSVSLPQHPGWSWNYQIVGPIWKDYKIPSKSYKYQFYKKRCVEALPFRP